MPESSRRKLGLPPKPFFYTVDQIASLLSLEEDYIRRSLLHYEGRSVGPCPRDKILAINIAPEGEKPEWRVTERKLITWMRLKGVRYYERGYVK